MFSQEGEGKGKEEKNKKKKESFFKVQNIQDLDFTL